MNRAEFAVVVFNVKLDLVKVDDKIARLQCQGLRYLVMHLPKMLSAFLFALLIAACQSPTTNLPPEIARFSPNLPPEWRRSVGRDQIVYSCNYRNCADYGAVIYARLNPDSSPFVDSPDRVVRSQYFKDHLASQILRNVARDSVDDTKISFHEHKSGSLPGFEMTSEGIHGRTGMPFGTIGRVIIKKNGNFMLVTLGKDLPRARSLMQIALQSLN